MISEELRTKISVAVGKATASWENLEGAGVFDDKTACEAVDDIVNAIEEEIEKGRNFGILSRIELIDKWLDEGVGDAYLIQPLAQDWARVAKTKEEGGEAVDALIGVTGQNPRKGYYGTWDDLYDELADVCLTGAYAIQHFTKDYNRTGSIITRRLMTHVRRINSNG
jgi:hypothetical protein